MHSYLHERKKGTLIHSYIHKTQKKLYSHSLLTKQLMGKNPLYKGAEIMVKLYRGSDYPWEYRAMETGRAMSKGIRDFKHKGPFNMPKHTMDVNSGIFEHLSPRELRNRHAISSIHNVTGEDTTSHTPTSNYVSLTESPKRASEWATNIYRFDVWRSDVFQGGVDYDRGRLEKEWLIEGDTKIYNIEVSTNNGDTWRAVDQILEDDSTLFERLQHINTK